jgi:pyruvate/2-oxoglutarate dehydrogenase complex dihydrolipoamide acyltransferase (E2) component
MMKGYKPVARLSTFRRIALSLWDTPKTGLIYGHVVIDATKALEYIARVEQETGVRLSVGVLAGRAFALAFMETPAFNSKIIWGQICEKDTVDVYFQVDIDDGGDLAGVVVRDTQTKDPVAIAGELRSKAKKLRSGEDQQYEKSQKGLLGKMPPWLIRWFMGLLLFLQYNLGLDLSKFGADLDPFGTVMISNVGPFKVDVAYAPLTPASRIPAVILVGGIQKKAMVVGDEVKVRPTFACCGTFDHRFADGSQIGRVQRCIQGYLKDPEAYENAIKAGQDMPHVADKKNKAKADSSAAPETEEEAEVVEKFDNSSLT